MTYKVIFGFRDKEDNKKSYSVGDVYDGKTTQKRIKELSTKDNNAGRPLIEEVIKTKGSK